MFQVKKSPPEAASSGFFVGGDAGARVAHLEHSVRFLQEQHRQMLSGLHAEIEALRERNRGGIRTIYTSIIKRNDLYFRIFVCIGITL